MKGREITEKEKKKERGKNETEKERKKRTGKKNPMWELNPSTAGHHYHIATTSGVDCTY